MAATLLARGRLDEAEELMRRALEGRRIALGADHPDTLDSLSNLCTVRLTLRALDAAESSCLAAVELSRKIRPDHPKTLVTINNLGQLLELQGRLDEAERTQLEAQGARAAALGPGHAQTKKAVEHLVELYDAWGKPEQAARWRDSL